MQRSCQLDALLMREMETGKHLSKTLMAHWTQSKCLSIKPKRTPIMSHAGALVGNFAYQVRSLFFTRMPRALGVPKTLPCLLCFVFSGMGVSFFMLKTHTTQVTQPHLILGQRYLSSSPSLGCRETMSQVKSMFPLIIKMDFPRLVIAITQINHAFVILITPIKRRFSHSNSSYPLGPNWPFQTSQRKSL